MLDPARNEDARTASDSGIFISYRRDDTAGFAGRLYDHLVERFGAGRVFMDVDTIRPGQDFAEVLRTAVRGSGVLLALIGPAWGTLTGPGGGRRIDDEADFVRVEIETALEAVTLVIPVLVQGAKMPQASDLPESLRPLAHRHAVEISHGRWRADVELLTESIVAAGLALPARARGRPVARVGGAWAGRPARWLALGGAGLAAVLVGFFALGGLGGGSPTPSASATGTAVAVATQSPAPTEAGTPVPSPTVAASPTPEVPTGTRIVFSRQTPLFGIPVPCDEPNADAKLFVIDPDDAKSEPYRITARTDLVERNPVWSDDGAQIVFAGDVQIGPPFLFAIPPPGEPLVTIGVGFGLNFGTNQLALAPDGTYVVHGADALWRYPVAGGEREFIGGIEPPENPETPPVEATEGFVDYTFRPDGTLIVLVAPFTGNEPRLESWKADGSSRERLDFDLGDRVVSQLALARDGDTVVLQSDGEAGSELHLGHLSESGADLSVLDVGPNAREPAFSPDMARLAFTAGEPGSEQIRVIDLDTREVTQVTRIEGAVACSPSWADAPPDLAGPRPEPAPGEKRPFEIGPLAAGPYDLDLVQPRMGLTFPEGWVARRNYVDGWSVYYPGAPGEVDHGRVQVGYAGPCGDAEPVLIEPRSIDLVKWLQGRRDLRVSEPSPINLAGYSGLLVDVSGRPDRTCEDQPDLLLWNLFRMGQDNIYLGEDEHLRLVALDVQGTAIPLMVLTGGDLLDDYWNKHARPLLETITFPSP